VNNVEIQGELAAPLEQLHDFVQAGIRNENIAGAIHDNSRRVLPPASEQACRSTLC
jgi:hypothetical protein